MLAPFLQFTMARLQRHAKDTEVLEGAVVIKPNKMEQALQFIGVLEGKRVFSKLP